MKRMSDIESKLKSLAKRECPKCYEKYSPDIAYPFKLCPKCMKKKGRKGVAIHDYE